MSQIETDRQTVDQNVSEPELKPTTTIIPSHNIRHQNDDSFDDDNGQEITIEKGSTVLEEEVEIVKTLICPLCLKVLYLNTQTSTEKECWESHFKFVCESQKDEKAKQEIKKFCAVFNCKSQLVGVNQHKCTGCSIEYCLRHRAHEKHPCTSEEYVEIVDSEERKKEILNFFNPPKPIKKGTETSEKKSVETNLPKEEEKEEKKVQEVSKEKEEIVKKRIIKEKEGPVEEKKKVSKTVTTKKTKKQSDEALYKKVKQVGFLETLKSEYIEPYRKFKYSSELTLLIGIILVFIVIENAF